MQKQIVIFVLLFLAGLSFAAPALAGEPVVWAVNSRAELLKGEARGVSVTDSGLLTLAPALSQLFNTEQAYVWSTAIDSAGNIYLGTGHDGKLFRVTLYTRSTLLRCWLLTCKLNSTPYKIQLLMPSHFPEPHY